MPCSYSEFNKLSYTVSVKANIASIMCTTLFYIASCSKFNEKAVEKKARIKTSPY